MLILAVFVILGLLAAGIYAVTKGDTVAFAGLIVVLALAVLVGAPQALLLLGQFQQALDATVPLAFR